MFEELLSGIFHQNGLTYAEAKQQQYVKQLRPYGKDLWQSYQQQDVTVDYSQAKTQEAYLLRYFPFYTLSVEKKLDALRERGHTGPVLMPETTMLLDVAAGFPRKKPCFYASVGWGSDGAATRAKKSRRVSGSCV